MTPNDKGSKDSDSNIFSEFLQGILQIQTWKQLVFVIIISIIGALGWDWVYNGSKNQRELVTTFVNAGSRPVLFPEDFKFLNDLLSRYPNAKLSVVQVEYVAGVPGKPLRDITQSEKVVLLRGGVPIAVILISKDSPPVVKKEIADYFLGNTNDTPSVPLIEQSNDKPQPAQPSPGN
jgi:hypothetical protein